MNVTRCNLVKLNWNKEMPAEMPLLKDYDRVNGVPRYEINDEITEDKSHIVQKSMFDRFISEDNDNCPVKTYKIEKVMNSNNSIEVFSDEYDEIFRLNKTNGTFTVFDFTKVIDTW